MQLVALVGIPQGHVSKIEHGKLPNGKGWLMRLGKALGAGFTVFWQGHACRRIVCFEVE